MAAMRRRVSAYLYIMGHKYGKGVAGGLADAWACNLLVFLDFFYLWYVY
jgi:hypothetical protein